MPGQIRLRSGITRFALLLPVLFACFARAETASPEWLPGGDDANWTLEWSDEFDGPAGDETDPNVSKWYPMIGYTPGQIARNQEKELRWAGEGPESAWFHSTKSGNHWLDGEGHLLLRAVVDKEAAPNANGPLVKTAYLMTGRPAAWDPDPEHDIRWEPGEGIFVSPTVDGEDRPVYLSARINTAKVVGHSTWFAFWLFSQTRSYNNVPADGTEVDVMEVVAGDDPHFDGFFNVAHHWFPEGKVKEDRFFNTRTDPPAAAFADLTRGGFHTWGLEWSREEMKCYVDGNLYHTFTDRIPTDPVDMMMMLTLEFQPDLWLPGQGDGRTSGPFVSDTPELRVLSEVLVDYVRVYRRE